MNIRNFLIIFVVLFLFLFVFADCVFALDNVTSDDFVFEDSVDCLSVSSDFDDVLGRSYSLNGGGFSDVRDVISRASDGDTIKLSGKFTSDGKIINVNKKLKFTSSDGAIFDGKDKSGIFYIKKNARGSSFYNLKFINGKRFAASAMFIDAKDITLDKCEFRDNHGTGNGEGAVATIWDKNNASGLTVKNCVFKSNSAPASSGALAAFSTNFKIINCVFENNYAKNNVGRTAYEGALQAGMAGTTGTISGCTFKNNYVKTNNNDPSQGGALAIRTGTTVQNCYFEGNTADYGGAIIFFSSGTVKNCTFKNNKANIYGGAIATENSQSTKNIQITDSRFYSNSAPDAGAIYLKSTKNTIRNCIFENNNAKNDAGAIQIDQGSTDIINSEFKNNTCKKYAGAIKINTNNIKITNSFTYNTAKYGGAIYINQDFTAQIISSTFINNNADNGSAIYNKGNLKITDSNIKDNTAKSYKLESDNTNVKQGQTATIKAYLEYGDNTPGIYTTNTLIIDEKTPTLSVAAQNQQITLNISNTIYKSKTNKHGIATFKIQTKKLTKNNYTFTLKHSTSTTATQIINNNTTLTIQKENKTDNTKNQLKLKKQ